MTKRGKCLGAEVGRTLLLLNSGGELCGRGWGGEGGTGQGFVFCFVGLFVVSGGYWVKYAGKQLRENIQTVWRGDDGG